MKYRCLILSWFFIFNFGFAANLSSAESTKFCAPAAVGSAMLCLEYVAYAHPVLAIIGSTVGLAEVARYAYKVYKKRAREKREQNSSQETEAEGAPPVEVFLAERYYYEQRKQELIKLRDEFAGIYRGIVAIKELFNPNAATFSSQFLQNILKNHTPVSLLGISITDELKLSDERKMALRKIREQELELIETEINELHAILVVQFNELRASTREVYDAYDTAAPTIDHAINAWNMHRNGELTDHIASQMYEQSIVEECLVHDIQQKVAELKVIVTYYQKSKSLVCLQQSTDIIDQLDGLMDSITDYEQWISGALTRIARNLSINEHYFAQRGIPTAGFKNQIKSVFYKDRSNKNAQALQKAKDTQASMGATGGPNDPKKPEDDDKDNFFKKLKARSDKKARTNRFGNMFRDPATKLWWSKDLDGHGGSCFKVFKETATGFEWVFDATKEGVRIVAKHKGPTGLFIPYKEVIF